MGFLDELKVCKKKEKEGPTTDQQKLWNMKEEIGTIMVRRLVEELKVC